MAEYSARPSTAEDSTSKQTPDDSQPLPHPKLCLKSRVFSSTEGSIITRNSNSKSQRINYEIHCFLNNVLTQTFEESEELFIQAHLRAKNPKKLTLKQVTDFAMNVNDKIQGIVKAVVKKLLCIFRTSLKNTSIRAMTTIKNIINNRKIEMNEKKFSRFYVKMTDSSCQERELQRVADEELNTFRGIIAPTKHLIHITVDILLRRVSTAISNYMKQVQGTVKSCIEDRKCNAQSVIKQIDQLYEFTCGNAKVHSNSEEPEQDVKSAWKNAKLAMAEVFAQMEVNVERTLNIVQRIETNNENRIVETFKKASSDVRLAVKNILERIEASAENTFKELKNSVGDVKKDMEFIELYRLKDFDTLMTASLRYIIYFVEGEVGEICSISTVLVDKVDKALDSNLLNAENLIDRCMTEMDQAIQTTRKIMDTAIMVLSSQFKNSQDLFGGDVSHSEETLVVNIVQSVEDKELFAEDISDSEEARVVNIAQSVDDKELPEENNTTSDEDEWMSEEEDPHPIRLSNILKNKLRKVGVW